MQNLGKSNKRPRSYLGILITHSPRHSSRLRSSLFWSSEAGEEDELSSLREEVEEVVVVAAAAGARARRVRERTSTILRGTSG